MVFKFFNRENPRPKKEEISRFIDAAVAGDVAVIAELLNKYGVAIVNRHNSSDWTPLMVAAHNGHVPVVALLFEKGASLHHRDQFGWTALIVAASNGHKDAVAFLLEKGADVEAKDYKGQTAETSAILRGHAETAKIFKQWPKRRATLARLEKLKSAKPASPTLKRRSPPQP